MNWSMISQVSRLRRRAIRAVAQKTQPMAQPTCEERQRLTAPVCATESRPSPPPIRPRCETGASGTRRSATSPISLTVIWAKGKQSLRATAAGLESRAPTSPDRGFLGPPRRKVVYGRTARGRRVRVPAWQRRQGPSLAGQTSEKLSKKPKSQSTIRQFFF